MNKKITVKELLIDKYEEFKEKYCQNCFKGRSGSVSNYIIDGFADIDEYCNEECSLEHKCKKECPNCNKNFYYLEEKKMEEDSYWFDEDEPSSVLTS